MHSLRLQASDEDEDNKIVISTVLYHQSRYKCVIEGISKQPDAK